jgi:hypothetical protein
MEMQIILKVLDLSHVTMPVNLGMYEASQINEWGSIALRIANDETNVGTEMRAIASAYFDDDNQKEIIGPLVNLILFHRNGVLCELQIYRDDDSALRRPINPEELFT